MEDSLSPSLFVVCFVVQCPHRGPAWPLRYTLPYQKRELGRNEN